MYNKYFSKVNNLKDTVGDRKFQPIKKSTKNIKNFTILEKYSFNKPSKKWKIFSRHKSESVLIFTDEIEETLVFTTLLLSKLLLKWSLFRFHEIF